MLKNLAPFILIPLFLSACSSSRYYFNKRIDHPDAEIKQETTSPINNTVTVDPFEEKQPVVMAPEEDQQAISNVTVTPVEKQVITNDQPLAESSTQPEQVQQKNETIHAIQKINTGKTFHRASSVYLDGWGVFFLVIASIFVLTVLISLLLGYNIGLSLLYGLCAILIIILLLLWLLFLSNHHKDDESDNGDDD
jgi:hypothetical protein